MIDKLDRIEFKDLEATKRLFTRRAADGARGGISYTTALWWVEHLEAAYREIDRLTDILAASSG